LQFTDYPALYRSADDESLDAQNRFYGALGTNIICLIFSAFISAVDIKSSWASILQVILLLVSLAMSIYLATARPERVWYNGRAVAESVKTSTWRYMMKAEPFDQDIGADQFFTMRLKEIFDQNLNFAKLLTRFSGDSQITVAMQNIRLLALEERKKFYENQRVSEQQIWYSKKAQQNKKKANKFFIILCSFNGAALICAIFKIKYPETSFWPTDAFVTCAAAAISWIQAKRFQEHSASYALASYEIGFIKEQLVIINSENGFSLFVGDAENAFSREHTQWSARKDE